MKRAVRAGFLAVMILGAALAFAADKGLATYTGYISDKSCGPKVDAACNKMCFDQGLPPVLVVDKTGDILEFEDPAPFKAHPAAHVEVQATVAGKVLHTVSFKVLSEPAPAPHAHEESADGAPIPFPNGQGFVRLPFELLGNVPYIQVKVNGKGPFLFAVDTGSHLVFAQELAAEMGLDPASKAGDAVQLTLGDGLTIPAHTSFAFFQNLWGLPGRRIYGDIGYSVLKHFVAEFDYEHRTLTLYDPQKFHAKGAAAALPAVLAADYDPQFEGTFTIPGSAPIPAKFTLDTGAGGTVISVPLVKKYGLLERVTQQVPLPPSKPLPDGVNGVVFEAITARIPAVGLGQYRVEQPLIALSRDSGTVFATDLLGVNLGGNILRHFTLTIDYPGRRVMLEPNGQIHDPFLADASGLVLTAEDPDFKRFVVHGVVPQSPADRAGLKEGDVIAAIDGEPAGRYALWQLQELLKQSGKERRLTIRRGASTLVVTIKLRALV